MIRFYGPGAASVNARACGAKPVESRPGRARRRQHPRGEGPPPAPRVEHEQGDTRSEKDPRPGCRPPASHCRVDDGEQQVPMSVRCSFVNTFDFVVRKRVADGVPVVEHPVRVTAEEPRAIHDVGVAVEQRLEHGRVLRVSYSRSASCTMTYGDCTSRKPRRRAAPLAKLIGCANTRTRGSSNPSAVWSASSVEPSSTITSSRTNGESRTRSMMTLIVRLRRSTTSRR